MAPLPTSECDRPVDRVAVRTAMALLAKAERSDFDAESLAFLQGSYRVLGRVLSAAAPPAAARPVAAGRGRAAYVAVVTGTAPTLVDLRG